MWAYWERIHRLTSVSQHMCQRRSGEMKNKKREISPPCVPERLRRADGQVRAGKGRTDATPTERKWNHKQAEPPHQQPPDVT